ncbi:hypothetical protein FUAX_54580 (plasmid) [Fulvitalea axinellae]|uniref:Uncharacterized protein n=1 Tax=Fulvitalea axinellae TaxID=1182444 RepID=A0AAU9CLZ9_9BACT|nr:hypothetical protein FUAX_54580 [Fulvitalea axinellae]
MCSTVYLGADHPLPEIDWNPEKPGLHISELDSPEDIEHAQGILHLPYLYQIGSFMGCSCGLAYADFLNEDHDQERRADVKDLLSYLKENVKDKQLKVISLSMDKFPDEYPLGDFFIPDTPPENEFFLPEDRILNLIQP